MVHDSGLSLELIEGENLLELIAGGLKLPVEDRVHDHILKHRFRLFQLGPESLQQNILDNFALGLFLALLEFKPVNIRFCYRA